MTQCGLVVERLSRSFIELSCDGTQFCLTVYRQICAFWEVLSQQPIGVFVCTTLPRIARLGDCGAICRGGDRGSHRKTSIPNLRYSGEPSGAVQGQAAMIGRANQRGAPHQIHDTDVFNCPRISTPCWFSKCSMSIKTQFSLSFSPSRR